MTLESKNWTHMRVQWVVYVLVEASDRASTPVLKGMYIGLSLVLQERKRESHLASVLSKQTKNPNNK